jgi:uncharacterized protein
MNEQQRKDYIVFRIEKANNTYYAAEVLSEKELWSSVINRLYYSCFYVVTALLLKNKISAKSHKSVKSKFSQEFIKNGAIDEKYGKIFNDLHDWRKKGDYDDIFEFEPEEVKLKLKEVGEFLQRVIQIINIDRSTI